MRPNRRTLLKGGLATACAALAATLPKWTIATQSIPVRDISLFVADDSFAQGRAFAEEAAHLGRQVKTFSADVTALWYHHLYHRWQQPTSVIAGLTGRSALFCLERLAWDASHRVVLRIDHVRSPSGTVSHEITASDSMLPHFSLEAGSWPKNWAAATARLLLTNSIAPHSAGPPAPLEVGASSSRWPEPLVSWVIAPRGWGNGLA